MNTALNMPDYWIVKTDSLGNIEWQNTIGGNADDYLYTARQTNDDGYILAGTSRSDSSGDKTESSNNSWQYWVVKTDFFGQILWQKTIGNPQGYGNLKTAVQTSDNGYILGGNNNLYYIVKIDSIGNIEWEKNLGGDNYESCNSAQQASDNGYIVGGTSTSSLSGD